jgi:hypothetical protein
MKFVAAGDMIIQQRIQHNYPGFGELSPFIRNADASFLKFRNHP